MELTASVGRDAANEPNDVLLVQRLLNQSSRVLGSMGSLVPDGHAGRYTIRAIEEFQRRVLGMAPPDGRVDPGGRTYRELVRFSADPVASRLSPPHLQTPATWKIRLADFETGKADLRSEHEAWLEQTVGNLTFPAQFWVYIFGYASKLGPAQGGFDPATARAFNRQLSYDRASAVAGYMERLSPRVTSRIREFSARGSDDYAAPADDNSADERAVEVHVYFVPIPPPPPDDVEPILPGGPRYTRWAIASPGGISTGQLVVVAGNVVVFRCHERHEETHWYLQLAGGPGYSYAGPKLSKIAEIIKNLLSKVNYSGMEFTEVTAITPFNFGDLDGATCEISSAGGGVGVRGHQYALMSVYGKVWHRDPNGGQMLERMDFVKNVDCSGIDYQLGVGASVVGGPLIRIK
jgi:hypothetical protein